MKKMPQLLLNFLHLILCLSILGGPQWGFAQNDKRAYEQHIQAAKEAERARLSGVDEYKKKKALEEKQREEAREAFRRKPVNKLKKVHEFDDYLKEYEARNAQRQKLQERFSRKQESQKSFDEVKKNLFENRPRVDQSRRTLYTGPAGSSTGSRGSTFSPSSSRPNRFGRGDDRDDRNDPPPVVDRGREDEPFVEEELPPEPPPFIEEGVEPRYDEDYIEDGEVMEGGGGDDYPPPPPPPPPEAFEEDL